MTGRRLLLVFGVVFVLLGVAAIMQGNQPTALTEATTTPTAAPAPERLFPDWQAEDIAALRLENPDTGHTFTLTRDAQEQWIAAESRIPLNQEVVKALLEAVTQLSYRFTLAGVPQERMAEYGLTRQDATLFIQVVLADQETHFIVIGALTTDATGLYSLVDEREAVYVIERAGGAADALLYYFNETLKPTPTR